MGKEIVYCGDCGKSIREEEFEKGKAQTIENRPYCAECRPVAPKPVAPLKGSSTRLSIPSSPPSTRRLRATSGRRPPNPRIIVACLAGVAVVVLIFLLGSGDRGRVEPSPPPTPSPSSARDHAEATFRELEKFAASSTDQDAILQRCDAVRGELRGTPFESRLRALEDRARDQAFNKARDAKLAMALENLRQIRSADPKFEKHEEVQRLLQAALESAGPRKADPGAPWPTRRKSSA